MMDFLIHLSVTLPTPIFGLLVAITLLLFGLVFYVGLYIIALIPGTGFLFVDIEEKLVSFIYQKLTNPSPRLRGKVSQSYRTDPRNRDLQHQLMGMLQGDTATAKRLLRQQRRNHPGKSDNWYLEKVIYDLERDRRR